MSKDLIEKKEQLPAFLQDKKDDAKEITSEFRKFTKPPRIKIVQALTKPPIKPPYKEGDIIVTPNLVKIGDNEEGFEFTPVHFFPSWSCLSPIGSGMKTIYEFSLDPNSVTAKKAKSWHKEPCPGHPDKMLVWRELLNWFILIHGVKEFENIPIQMSFYGAEYPHGQNFMGTIDAREAPMFSQRFTALTVLRDNPKGPYQGLALMKAGFVDDEKQYEAYKNLRADLKKGIESAQFELDWTAEGEEGVSEAAAEKF